MAVKLAAAALALGTISATLGCRPRETRLLLGDSAPPPTASAAAGVTLPAAADPGLNVAAIHVDTVGYPSSWRRLAMFTVEPQDARLWNITAGWTSSGPDGRPLSVRATGWRPTWEDITRKGTDEASGDPIWIVDFDDYAPPRGNEHPYYVLATGMTQQQVQTALAGGDRRYAVSAPFRIADFAYQAVAYRLLGSLYHQRCHTALGSGAKHCDGSAAPKPAIVRGERYTPLSRQGACHCSTLAPLCAAPQAGGQGWAASCPGAADKTHTAGGWHHGAGHGIYMATLAPTVQALATVALRAPELFDIGPDSSLLAELEHGLQWIERMQLRPVPSSSEDDDNDEQAGGFYAFEIPWGSATPKGSAAQDRRARYHGPIATGATAKATAALSVVARLYRELARHCEGSHCDRWRALAERTASAAASGFSFLTRHPRKQAINATGHGHPLWDDAQRYGYDTGVRLNAAVQVWALTGDGDVLAEVKRYLASEDTHGERLLQDSWANLARWGLATLASCRAHGDGCSDGFVRLRNGKLRAAPTADPPYPELAAEAQRRLLDAAMLLYDNIEDLDGYRAASRPQDYVWGHNARLLEKAALLAHAAIHGRRLQAHRARIERNEAAPELEQLEGRLRAMAAASRAPGQPAPKPLRLGWLLEASRDQWHWILGRNPNGHSMITGIGRGPTAMVHHEWAGAKALVPGYLLGGPNARQMGFLSPSAPAKALLLDHNGRLWQTERTLLGEHAHKADVGWQAVAEGSIYYTATALVALAELYRTRSL